MRSLVVLFVLVAAFRVGHGIQCYQCDSDENQDCADEFLAENSLATCDPSTMPGTIFDFKFSKQCYKVKHYGPDMKTVRGCAFLADGYDFCTLAGKTDSENGKLECEVCEEDSCNSGGLLLPSLLMPIVSLLYLRL